MEFTRIWYETDVRSVLPSIQTPTLLLTGDAVADYVDETKYVASLLPNATVHILEGHVGWEDSGRMVDPIREFVGIETPPADIDTILSSVMFTDIVGSTEMQASMGDHSWKDLVQRHHATVRHSLDRWRGMEVDTAGDGFYATFDGPARAIRCAQEIRDRVHDLGIEVRAGVHLDLTDRKGPGSGVRPVLRRRRRARAEGCPRPLAPVPGGKVGSTSNPVEESPSVTVAQL
jgi:hypothetical protein